MRRDNTHYGRESMLALIDKIVSESYNENDKTIRIIHLVRKKGSLAFCNTVVVKCRDDKGNELAKMSIDIMYSELKSESAKPKISSIMITNNAKRILFDTISENAIGRSEKFLRQIILTLIENTKNKAMEVNTTS